MLVDKPLITLGTVITSKSNLGGQCKISLANKRMNVFVKDKEGNPLMPTTPAKARKLLKRGGAVIVGYRPFTIQLTYESRGYRQDVTLGIDTGYEMVGYSAVSERAELFGGEVELMKGQTERYKERAMYRRTRRGRKRYRKPRWDNRSRSCLMYENGQPIRKRFTGNKQSKSQGEGKSGWIAPSIQHKLETHLKIIAKVKAILPIKNTIIEVANFDIQAIKNPDIQGVEYQQGEQHGFWNLREYIFHRDGHRCQNPKCKNKSLQPVLRVHHIGYWKEDRTDRPDNLITICTQCHTTKNHQPGGDLYEWQPRLNNFKSETFMSMVRWRLVNATSAQHTYGYITKSGRIALKRVGLDMEKSHHNDAFVIAGGTTQPRHETKIWRVFRHHKRSLETFTDAQYIDARTGEKATGKELNSGRTTRNRNLVGENLRLYRKQKIRKGKRAIQTKTYKFSFGDVVRYKGKTYICGGTGSNGYRVYLRTPDKKLQAKAKEVTLLAKQAGLLMIN